MTKGMNTAGISVMWLSLDIADLTALQEPLSQRLMAIATAVARSLCSSKGVANG